MGNQNSNGDNEIELGYMSKGGVASIFQSSMESEGETLAALQGNSGMKEKIARCLGECRKFLKLVRGHEPFYNISQKIAEMSDLLEKITKDIRYRAFLKVNALGYSSDSGSSSVLGNLPGASKKMARDRQATAAANKLLKKQEPVVLIFDSLIRQISRISDLFEDFVAKKSTLRSSSVPGTTSPSLSPSGSDHIQMGTEEMTNEHRKDYFQIKCEAEIILGQHAHQMILYGRFLLDIYEQDAKDREEKLKRERDINARRSTQPRANFRKKSSTDSDSMHSKSMKIGGPILTKPHFLQDDIEARKFWSESFGERIFAVGKVPFLVALCQSEVFRASLRLSSEDCEHDYHDSDDGNHYNVGNSSKQNPTLVTEIQPQNQLIIDDDIPELINIVDPTNDDVVSLSDFVNLLRWFGPFECIGRNMRETFNYPFFWGSLCSIDAQRLLQNQPIGTYLVRFNEHSPGSLTISCVQEQDEELGEFLQSQDSSQYARLDTSMFTNHLGTIGTTNLPSIHPFSTILSYHTSAINYSQEQNNDNLLELSPEQGNNSSSSNLNSGSLSTSQEPAISPSAYMTHTNCSIVFHFSVMMENGRYLLTNEDLGDFSMNEDISSISSSPRNSSKYFSRSPKTPSTFSQDSGFGGLISPSGLVGGISTITEIGIHSRKSSNQVSMKGHSGENSAHSKISRVIGFETIKELLEQYNLTFRKPFLDQTEKLDPIRKKRKDFLEWNNRFSLSSHTKPEVIDEASLDTKDVTHVSEEDPYAWLDDLTSILSLEKGGEQISKSTQNMKFHDFRGRLVPASKYTTSLALKSTKNTEKLKKALNNLRELSSDKKRFEKRNSIVGPNSSRDLNLFKIPPPPNNASKKSGVLRHKEEQIIELPIENTLPLSGERTPTTPLTADDNSERHLLSPNTDDDDSGNHSNTSTSSSTASLVNHAL